MSSWLGLLLGLPKRYYIGGSRQVPAPPEPLAIAAPSAAGPSPNPN